MNIGIGDRIKDAKGLSFLMTQSSHFCCIFVSLTFSDLKAGRNALQEEVIPRLRNSVKMRGCLPATQVNLTLK